MLRKTFLAVALLSTVATAAFADVNSNSVSGAAANTSTSTFSTQGQSQGQGQNQSSTSGATSNQTQSTSSAANSNQSTTASQGNTQVSNFVSPNSETIRSAPAIAAPALSTTLTETCMGSYSGGVSFIGGAVTAGGTVVDKACVRRLNARELAQTLQDRDAAKEVMCGDADVRKAYEVVGRPCGVKYVPPVAPAPAPAPTPAPVAPVVTPAPAPAPVAPVVSDADKKINE